MHTCTKSLIFAAILASWAGMSVAQTCDRFDGSTMTREGVVPAAWRTDFPDAADVTIAEPWKTISFRDEPSDYMFAVLDTFRSDFSRVGPRLASTGTESWWIVPWMDYTRHGREPLMGLTKERSPRPGDLSPSSTGNYQVWAVGFYNAPGAAVVGEIYADPCDPQFPRSVDFPDGTVSVKLLFTDAPTEQLHYLADAPTYHAFVDPSGEDGPPSNRVRTDMRLLQVDIAVRDERADPVGWVFGTFAWTGVPRGDGLFDNLEPVSLQWGDDPGVTRPRDIRETWINPWMEGVTFGWWERQTLGFMGRANGPADNIRSSCISCHATARLPSVPGRRLTNSGFDMIVDLADPAKVAEHVATWFINLPGGDDFAPDVPPVSALNYSLQLDAAAYRMCRACIEGALQGATPQICLDTEWTSQTQCGASTESAVAAAMSEAERFFLELADEPPRQ